MTPPPDDDRLVAFLRQHRPVPPAPAPALETRIIAAIQPLPRRPRAPWRDRPWHYGVPALAAAVLVAWGVGVSRRPAAEPATELADLETFMTEVWYGAIDGDAARIPLDTDQPDWLVSVYATPY
ncbi:MAG TPA: hypothetical protein V6D02_16590 [Candidatus Obscuribacterales bacterium]